MGERKMIENISNKTQVERAPTQEIKRHKNDDADAVRRENITTSEDEKKEEKIDTEEAVERIVKAANYFNREIHFELEKELDIMVVKVIDSETDEVIRQIPPEELVELSKNAKDLKGLLINTEG
jgi:flagellar protein FlaG